MSSKAALPHSALNHFLKLRRQSFLASRSHNVLPNVVMGNEAGDLDSLACSIAFAYLSSLSSSTAKQDIYPLIQTYRRDLHLRPENQLALQSCLIDPQNLICLEDLEEVEFKVGKLSLVDHNKLTSRFKDREEDDVEAVIDHHEDEKLYQSASIRRIVPPTSAGSCASVLSLHFKSQLPSSTINEKTPPELATLLLSAILIDTHCLDPKVGKAKADDLGAVGFLYPLSSLKKQEIPESNLPKNDGEDQETAMGLKENSEYAPNFSDLDSFHQGLSKAKNDVSGLNTVDLIRRDYKEYIHPSPNSNTWTVGLTSVPIGIQSWISKETIPSFLSGCQEFLSSKNLDLLGILTAFVDPKDNQFKREVLLFSSEKSRDQSEKLSKVLQQSEEVQLQEIQIQGLTSGAKSEMNHWLKIYDQKMLKATRKQVAPAVKEACSKVEGPSP